MIAGALLLALAAARSDITLVTPADSGEVSLAVVEWRGAHFVDFLRFPPAAAAAEGEFRALIEYPDTRVEAVLAGPPLPRRLRVRAVYPEVWSMRIGRVRKLAVLERTTGGYWFDQWDTYVQDGRACLSSEAIEHFHIVIHSRGPDRNGEICLDV